MIFFYWIILIFCLLLIVYNYILYPYFLKIKARHLNLPYQKYREGEWPKVALVFAAYNEEKVIEAKMKNLNKLNYPTELLDIFIGLDSPNDRTEELIEQNLPLKFPVHVELIKERGGKSNVLNQLFNKVINKSDYEVVVLMDANIISKENLLFELVKYFKDEQIGQVGAVIQNEIDQKDEIAIQEKFYISKENEIKVNEGKIFGASIGAFGACYAIRPKFILPIPSNYLMEDFYISMHVLNQGAKCITNPSAIVYEDLPGTIFEEFKRKRRISTGNFQNLAAYFHFLNPFKTAHFVPFFSHKFLRWISPFLILIFALVSLLIFLQYPNFISTKILLVFCASQLILPFIDFTLQRININVNLLRLHRYFLLMNFALFLGFIDWIMGVKTNIWKPTERK